MLTICIPTYNYDAFVLISCLLDEISKHQLPVKILVIDDCSTNRQIVAKMEKNITSPHKLITLSKNIGRAAIRNRFIEHATSEYLLFLDGDANIPTENFIQNYLSVLKEKKWEIVCGGRKATEKPPAKDKLRWEYAKKREYKSVEARNMTPYKSFMTNNFVVKREYLKNNPFDEKLTGYGHEDTLFGFVLQKNKVAIFHVDNPILDYDLVSDKEFIEKTAEATRQLVTILKDLNFNEEFINYVRLLKFYYFFKSNYLLLLMRIFIGFISNVILWFRLGFPLILLDIYKLKTLHQEIKKTAP